jgi:hypothetical protein
MLSALQGVCTAHLIISTNFLITPYDAAILQVENV